jgi:hypothetical protein
MTASAISSGVLISTLSGLEPTRWRVTGGRSGSSIEMYFPLTGSSWYPHEAGLADISDARMGGCGIMVYGPTHS